MLIFLPFFSPDESEFQNVLLEGRLIRTDAHLLIYLFNYITLFIIYLFVFWFDFQY